MTTETMAAAFTPEWEDEQHRVMTKLLEAFERHDEAAIDEWSRKLEPPADALVAAKRSAGVDFIRKRGYITRLAEKKYGKDWLEKSDDELLKMSIRLGPGD